MYSAIVEFEPQPSTFVTLWVDCMLVLECAQLFKLCAFRLALETVSRACADLCEIGTECNRKLESVFMNLFFWKANWCIVFHFEGMGFAFYGLSCALNNLLLWNKNLHYQISNVTFTFQSKGLYWILGSEPALCNEWRPISKAKVAFLSLYDLMSFSPGVLD